ncbi:hypothetical protein INT43_008002 [Umbelopsis isabellina]|uniref:Autophagy-related protein n=1 Tax=Mortierella isabellina TaxID=91625 RepID=A0A8H7PPB3_MORIS|nr:hypothetical protein INT43_008002 [Umbelopsis isabellina]
MSTTPIKESIHVEDIKVDSADVEAINLDKQLGGSLLPGEGPSSEPETTRGELWGFYTFAFAADGYLGATSSVFQPLIISAMATLGGRSTLDHTKACISADNCEVLFGTVWVSPTSYSLYSSAVSVAVQAFVAISLGAIADHSGYAKVYLFSFAYLCSLSVILWIALQDPRLYYAANILNIVGNVCYGSAFVFYTSYIPKLARNHPEVLNASTVSEKLEKLTFRTSRISIFGSASGFFGGFIQMLIAVGILYAMNETLFSMKVATMMGGLWWALFAIPGIFLLKRRPGPPLPKGENYLFYSWKKTYQKFRYAKRLSQLFLFLLFYFFVSDSASTILKVAVLFAQNEIHVSNENTLMGTLVELGCAVPGMLLWHWAQKRFKWKPKTLVFALTLLTGALPAYVLGGFSSLPGGFKSPNEWWGLCAFYGLMQPALYAFCRALYAQLIPRGHENEMFALFSITAAGGGWIGPLICGVIGDVAGTIRYAMIFVVAGLYLPLILLYFIDIDKGIQQAKDVLQQELGQIQLQEQHAENNEEFVLLSSNE